jgi:hypothetical protein
LNLGGRSCCRKCAASPAAKAAHNRWYS